MSCARWTEAPSLSSPERTGLRGWVRSRRLLGEAQPVLPAPVGMWRTIGAVPLATSPAAPTLDDARRAAEAVAGAGASQVLLEDLSTR